ncbi:2'-5' RNA ligase family protein [Pontibacter silvestris]|uniref:2'-5' RNA ligase family protein n=1 Tax=Pontibacter silvestris TaxID=2305183 RepID=A0ABW4X405_9BACT|nr:2'-5' RNA ligase family protein [Pontibacter silvestris]MCC9135084.1 2'-5' RNA ligase family protein [Pontibacter silvestris]
MTAKIDLHDHYKKMWDTSFNLFEEGAYELDPLIDVKDDTRYGVTLLARLSPEVKENILKFLDKLKLHEPGQYFYPASDLHITVMSFISCYAGFHLNMIKVEEYVSLIQSITAKLAAFQVHFSGITASPSCIMVQGFPNGDSLQELRDELRVAFKDSGLQQTMDTRYTIVTAHSTVLRFKELPTNSKVFNEVLEKYRDHDFGTALVHEVELVSNDWYQRQNMVKQLAKLKLLQEVR